MSHPLKDFGGLILGGVGLMPFVVSFNQPQAGNHFGQLLNGSAPHRRLCRGA